MKMKSQQSFVTQTSIASAMSAGRTHQTATHQHDTGQIDQTVQQLGADAA